MNTIDTTDSASDVTDETLWRLIQSSAISAIQMIIEASSDGKSLPQYTNYPTIEYNKDGSFFRRSTGPAPSGTPNYSGIFSHTKGDAVNDILHTYDEVVNYSDLKEYLTNTPPYVEFYSPRKFIPPGRLQRWQKVAVFDLLASLCDRYISLNGLSLPINEDSLRRDYCRLERWISSSELPVEVLISIIGSSFDFDRVALGDCSIEHLPKDGLAQIWPANSAHQNNWIYATPSHCLVIPGFEINNVGYFRWLSYIPQVELPEIVGRFFQALQLAINQPNVGYGHYGFRPAGWSNAFIADLEPLIKGPTEMQYSQNDPVLRSPLAEEEYQLFTELFNDLERCDENIKFGTKKYRSALLRQDEADAIVEFCTALESILGDPNETTHKLALRISTIFSERGWVGCDQIFSWVKKMYSHRSDLVHGNLKVGRHRVIEPDIFGGEYTALDLARLVCREVLMYSIGKRKLAGKDVDGALLGILVKHAMNVQNNQ